MNREIKFRVFNHNIKHMYDVYGFNQRQIQWAKEDGSLGGSFSYVGNSKKNFTLLQYTGLKDKNGKEIYEGDIMGWECYEGTKHQVRWVVEYNLNQGFKTWSSTKNDEIVLGNIYENPELLK